METYSGYDPFTKRVYVREPRLTSHAETPETCSICHTRGHENLFVNPCIGCTCNIAVHASCWAEWGRDECMMCRKKFDVSGGALGVRNPQEEIIAFVEREVERFQAMRRHAVTTRYRPENPPISFGVIMILLFLVGLLFFMLTMILVFMVCIFYK